MLQSKVQQQKLQSAKIALWIALWKNWLCFARLPQIRRSRKKILPQRSVNRSARSKHARSRCRKKAISAVPTGSAAAIGKCWWTSRNRESDQESGYEKMRLTFATAEVNLIFLSQERMPISLQRYSFNATYEKSRTESAKRQFHFSRSGLLLRLVDSIILILPGFSKKLFQIMPRTGIMKLL